MKTIKPQETDALVNMRVLIGKLIIAISVGISMIYIYYCFKLEQYPTLVCLTITVVSLITSYILLCKRLYNHAFKLIFPSLLLTLCFTMITFGKDGHSSIYAPVLIFFIFILFDSIYECLFFTGLVLFSIVGSYIFLEIYGPTYSFRLSPYDYIINGTFSILSCGVLAYIIMKKYRSYIIQEKQSKEALRLSNLELAKKTLTIQNQNKELDLFNTLAAHDLKTPIHTISNYSKLIQRKLDQPKPVVKDYLTHLNNAAIQLHNLIEGITSYKKADWKQCSLEVLSTQKIIDDTIKLLDLENKNNIKISTSNLLDINVDKVHLSYIFQNLIENALKFNNAEVKKIKINSYLNSQYCIFEVSDNGIGIDSAYSDYIFEPFKKLNTKKGYKSSGLGLYTVKKVLEMYKGKISVLSNQDEGSTFLFYFPKSYLIEQKERCQLNKTDTLNQNYAIENLLQTQITSKSNTYHSIYSSP